MEDRFKLEIRTPDKTIFDGEADSVSLATETGELEVLSGHASLAANLIYTKAFIKIADKIEEWVLRSGVIFFSNNNNALNILVSHAEEMAEIDTANVEDYLKLIEEKLSGGDDISHFELKYLENEKLAIIKQLTQ